MSSIDISNVKFTGPSETWKVKSGHFQVMIVHLWLLQQVNVWVISLCNRWNGI